MECDMSHDWCGKKSYATNEKRERESKGCERSAKGSIGHEYIHESK